MNKNILAIAMIVLFICSTVGASFAADTNGVSVDKTAIKTGNDTAQVTITVNGSDKSTIKPVDVSFAVDSSGSMSTSDPTNLRQQGADNFVDKMNATQDKAGVVNWDSGIQSSQPLTNNFATVKSTIDSGYAGGTTNMELAIATSIAQLDTDTLTPSGQKFIILLTDGQWNTGSDPLTAPDATPDAVTKGYTIYTIGLGSGVDATLLQNIADATGGKYYFATDANALNDIYTNIYKDITTTATNIKITDIIPDYMKLVGTPSVTPDSNILNPDGTTTLTWLIPQLSAKDSWTVNYNLICNKYGLNIPTNVKGDVSYLDPSGEPQTQILPIPTLDFPAPIIPNNNTTVVTNNTTIVNNTTVINNPVKAVSEPVKEINKETIPMQHTGGPFAPLAIGLISLGSGLIAARRFGKI
jgi:Mg-chelatase subunit ChlD